MGPVPLEGPHIRNMKTETKCWGHGVTIATHHLVVKPNVLKLEKKMAGGRVLCPPPQNRKRRAELKRWEHVGDHRYPAPCSKIEKSGRGQGPCPLAPPPHQKKDDINEMLRDMVRP